MSGATNTLLMTTGDLPSLVAVALHPVSTPFVLWSRRTNDPADAARKAAVDRAGEIFSAKSVIHAPASTIGVPNRPPLPGVEQSEMLLHAVAAAGQTGCRRIVWPIVAGTEYEAIAPLVDRAESIAALARIGPMPVDLTIDLPFVDLTDHQIVDLLDESGAPWDRFWPCERGGDAPCGTCSECRRWRGAFQHVGLPWPWEPAAAV